MVEIKESRKGMPMYYLWYAKEPKKCNGFVTYKQSLIPIGKNVEKFPTLLTDLTQEEEEIWKQFAKNCAYEIKRAKREEVSVEILESSRISEQEIREFCEFFDQFWESKGIRQADPEEFYKEAKTYIDNGCMVFSKAKIDGQTIVYHTYVVEGEYTRLLHSASLYRISQDRKPAIVGMANRYLHWEDMLYFKEKGIQKYDWGGAGEGEDVIGITRFKESFGGEKTFLYNSEVKQGIIAKAVYGLLVLRKKLRG